jgi:ribosomal protein S17E
MPRTEKALTSPPYVDRWGNYGIDFEHHKVGFGRVSAAVDQTARQEVLVNFEDNKRFSADILHNIGSEDLVNPRIAQYVARLAAERAWYRNGEMH